MNHKIYAALAVLFIFFTKVQSQTNELINSGDVLQKANQLRDDGKFSESIDLYKKISRSDTNYSQALQELALASYMDSDFAACKSFASLGLKLFPEETNTWYNLLAIGLGNTDEAIKYDDSIIQNNSNDYIAWYNIGIKLYNQKKYTDAEKYFQKTILIYPYYSGAHYFLGVIKIQEGQLPQAMLSLMLNLLLDPSNKYSASAVKLLSSISSVTDEVAENASKAVFNSDDNFDLQQQIILSKIALDKKYKLQSSLEDPITRQLQVLLEKLQYDKTDKGFWMQYYVPLFTDIFSKEKFNVLVNIMFNGLSIKSVQEYNKKNKTEIDELISLAADYLNRIRQTQQLDPAARITDGKRFYFDSKTLSGIGAWRTDDKKIFFTGPWKFYYANGKIKSEGTFNDNELYEGVWTIYYKSGKKKETLLYKDDKVNGFDSSWFDNGNISSIAVYDNGNLKDSAQTFYYNGFLKMVSHYTDGKKNGKETQYKSDGSLNYTANYTNDKPEGAVKYFYPDKKIASETFYKNGEYDGVLKKYDEKGKLILEGNYVSGKESGAWKEYYSSSKIKKEYSYQNGNLQGDYKDYYDNGQLTEEENYNSGKEDGTETVYNEDGKKISESIYEKGRVRELKFFDKSGNVISTSTTRNGAGNFPFFDENGNKTSEGYFTKDGLRDGKSTFYFDGRNISSEANYKNGELEGDKIRYYYNGVVYDKINYKSGKEDGYYNSFHENSVLSSEGWYVEGNKQQQFINYDALKNITEKNYYLDDDLEGYSEYYFPNGKKEYEQFYKSGWLEKITQFDTLGNVMEDISLPQGNADFLFKYPNGKTYLKGSYKHYNLSGQYQHFYFDGTPYSVSNYVYGVIDGNYTAYYYGGKTAQQGSYKKGKKDGEWKYYYENGQLNYTEKYEDGEENGKETVYNEDKTLLKESNYSNNMLEGDYKIYGDNNQLAAVLYYHKNNLAGYSYEGKDGKLVDTIKLKNSTGLLNSFYKSGAKGAEINFENNIINGKRNIFFSNGKIFIESTRLLDDENGNKKVYYQNGQLLSDENYLDGNLHGVAKYYYANGKIRMEQNWYNGQMNGTGKYYDENGKLLKTRFYYYDLLLSVN